MAAGLPSPAPRPLPRLRQELDLLPAPRERNGAPAWTLYDPVRSQFFRIGWLEFELLARWSNGSPAELAERTQRETGMTVTAEDVAGFAEHLHQNQLAASEPGSWRLFTALAAQRRQHGLTWLLHSYLFFRIPLLRPDRMLGVIEPRLRFLFSRGFLLMVLAAFVAGLYFAGRHWDGLAARLQTLATTNALPWFFAILILAKVLHEFGHGLVAKRFGVRVPVAGIAVVLMWPMLYTDTTDAWRLTSRWQRLAVGIAGVGTELVLAVFALLAWGLLPPGTLRDAALMTATMTWLMTLAVNLNPFMRFDGYYLLADFTDMPNLQPRAFQMARWWIRSHVLGMGDPAPEIATSQRRHWMVAYAIATWVYRLFLFISIAVLVYHFFVKLVGIGLFLVEIGWFIVLPISRELRVWWRRRGEMRLSRGGLMAAGFALVLGLLVAFPWHTRVEAPAVVRAASFVRLFPQAPGRIEQVHVTGGARVEKGTLLFTIAAPDIESNIAITQAKILAAEREVELSSTEHKSAERLGVLLGEIAARKRELQAFTDMQRRLSIRAPIAGEILDLPAEIREQRWVGDDTPLGILADRGRWALTAYVDEYDIARFAIGARVQFYPSSPDAPRLDGKVVGVDSADARTLEDKDLAHRRGGPIETRRPTAERLQPLQAIYKVHVEPLTPMATIPHGLRGTAHIEGEPQSLLSRFWRAALSVLIRETGF
jgi:putative peptide zinc metalloprotease protein